MLFVEANGDSLYELFDILYAYNETVSKLVNKTKTVYFYQSLRSVEDR